MDYVNVNSRVILQTSKNGKFIFYKILSKSKIELPKKENSFLAEIKKIPKKEID